MAKMSQLQQHCVQCLLTRLAFPSSAVGFLVNPGKTRRAEVAHTSAAEALARSERDDLNRHDANNLTSTPLKQLTRLVANVARSNEEKHTLRRLKTLNNVLLRSY